MSRPLTFHQTVLSTIFFMFTMLVFSQDSIPRPIERDTILLDTTVIDTIVIRKTLTRVKHIPRGVNLTNPVISFKKTKPLKDEYNRFRVPSFWTKENTFGLNLSEAAFVNWNAGGDNAISGLSFFKFVRNYKFRYFKWDNNLDLRYGLNAQEGRQLRKTEDVIRLNSNISFYGTRILLLWSGNLIHKSKSKIQPIPITTYPKINVCT